MYTSSIVSTKERLLSIIDKLRPEQADVIKQVVSAVKNNKKYICINAPTGFGKTLLGISTALYLLLRGCIPLIFVRTRSQLSAYVRDCVKFMHALPSIKLCKAEVCPIYRADSLLIPCGRCTLLKEITQDPSTVTLYDALVKLVEKKGIHDPYILAELLKKDKTVCPYFFFRLLHRVSDLHIHVCTYPYLAKLWGLLYDELRNEYGEDVKPCAIVDEAHNLEDSMFLTYATITERTLTKALRECEKIVTQYNDELAELVKLIIEAVLGYYALCKKQKLPDEKVLDPTPLVSAIEKVDSIDTVLMAVDTAADIVIRHYKNVVTAHGKLETTVELTNLSDFLHALFDAEEEVALVWSGQGLDVRSLDLDMRRLFEDFQHVVLMSGTLPPKDYVAKAWRLGKKLHYIDLSTRKFGKIRKLVDTTVTSRYVERSPEMMRAYADKIARIFQQAKRHVLSVAPSYELAHTFANLIQAEHPDIGEKMIIEEEDMKFGEVEEEVQKEPKLLIMAVAGGKLCEGVEFTKNGRSLLSDIVIAGIPYSPPTSYNKILEARVAKKSGLDPKYIRNVKAWILVRQALGRGVRNPEDKCNWWLLDYRFLEDFWKEKLLHNDYETINV